MGQPLYRNPLLLLACAMSSLFVGAAFIYMASKSPFFWGGLFLPGVALLLIFATTAILSVANLLTPVKSGR